MASQLSGERPRALDRRSAISGLTPLVPLSTRFSVDAATPRLTASCRPVRPFGSRYTAVMNAPGWGGLCIAISDSPRSPRRRRVRHVAGLEEPPQSFVTNGLDHR